MNYEEEKKNPENIQFQSHGHENGVSPPFPAITTSNLV